MAYSPSLKEVRGGTQGSHLEVRIKAQAMEECCLLTSSDLLNLLSYVTQGHQLRCGTAHSELPPPVPHQSYIQNNALQTCLQEI